MVVANTEVDNVFTRYNPAGFSNTELAPALNPSMLPFRIISADDPKSVIIKYDAPCTGIIIIIIARHTPIKEPYICLFLLFFMRPHFTNPLVSTYVIPIFKRIETFFTHWLWICLEPPIFFGKIMTLYGEHIGT